MIELVFWLVLYHWNLRGPAMTTIPVPYDNWEDCNIAGEQWQGDSENRIFTCVQMRRDTFENNGDQW